MDYREKVSEVRSRIAASCERSGRSPQDVRLIGVTKYVSVEEAKALLDAGITDLGENRLQQASEKLKVIQDSVTWHFIGTLQTNKVKEVIPHFQWIHSLDRLSLAKELQKQADKTDLYLSCLVQVNVSGELTKSGLALSEVTPFLQEIAGMDRIRVSGFMTMAPQTNDPEDVRPVFRKLRQLRDSLLDINPNLFQLSMGMSGDFEVAIEEGATMVRLGSILVKS